MDQHLVKLMMIGLGSVILVMAFSVNLNHLQALNHLLTACEKRDAAGAYMQSGSGEVSDHSVSGAVVLSTLGHRLRASDAQCQSSALLISIPSVPQETIRVEGVEMTEWDQLALISVDAEYRMAYSINPQGVVQWVDYTEIR